MSISDEWPDDPYKGLDYYTSADHRIFAGRQSEVESCSGILAASSTRTLVLHGKSGCGKSSFIRAGLFPLLIKFGYGFKVPTGKAFEPLIVRSGDRPLFRLAEVLFDLKKKEKVRNRPDLPQHGISAGVTKDEFCQRLSADPDVMVGFLESLALTIPETLVIFVDQSEEIFTLIDEDRASAEASDYFDFLTIFTQSEIDIKLVVSMRTEYKGVFDDELARRGVHFGDMPGFYLPQMTLENIKLAIEHPTVGEAKQVYGFEYAEGLSEKIASSLYTSRPHGGILPVMQVICRRLFKYTSAQRKKAGALWTISEKDFLELGNLDAQVDSYVEEGILGALESLDLVETQQVAELDRWREILQCLCGQEVDGRVVTRKLQESDMLRFASDLECQNPKEVGRRLATVGIIRIESETGRSTGDRIWSLGHDAMGLALSRSSWQASSSQEDDSRRQLLLDAGILRSADLFGGGPPGVVNINGVNDQIWDHELPLYASSKGFFRRLGIELEVPGHFDLRRATAFEYESVFKLRERTLIAVPEDLFGSTPYPGWTEIGVSNLFAGYALVGRRDNSLIPLKQLRGKSETKARISMFRKLMTKLAEADIHTKVIEQKSADFIKFLGELAGSKEVRVEQILEDLTAWRRDILYHCLISKQADFVVGPAPTRALAERAGFNVYLDAEDVFGLIDDILSDCGDRGRVESERRKLANLYMHNTWRINLGSCDSQSELSSRHLILRLASVLFFTIAYIRVFPEDFVRFIYGESLRSSGFPIDRLAIRRALSTSYKFLGFEEQKLYFDGQSEFRFKGTPHEGGGGAFGVYSELVSLRNAFWQHWGHVYKIESKEDLAIALRQRLRKAKQRAWSHYGIYNFFDAESIMRTVLGELRSSVGEGIGVT